MNTLLRSLTVILIALSLGACTSTRFVSTWQDPEVAFGMLNGEKIAVFLISDDESARRSAEDALASELTAKGARGVAGYTVMSAESAQDEAVAEKKLKEAGVDAVVTMRVVSEQQETTTTPATFHTIPVYRRWNGYWVRGWRTAYEPGQTRTNTIVQVETLIYEMDGKGLIWAGLSRTTNPREVDALVTEIAAAVDEAVKKTGLLH